MTDDEMDAAMRDWAFPQLNAAAGITPEWQQSFVALRMAQVLAQLAIGDELKHLPVDDRAYLKGLTEMVVTTVVRLYDAEMGAVMNRWRKRDEAL